MNVAVHLAPGGYEVIKCPTLVITRKRGQAQFTLARAELVN
jgi:hypothetical protein